MKYMGQFGKMEGLVYETINLCKSFSLPGGTRFYGGIDWGYTNPFVLSIRALTPDGVHYRVAEFYKSGLMIDEIVSICQQRKQLYNLELFVADPSAPANIEAFNRGGLNCIAANNDIRAGIDCQIRLFKEEKFFIFEDDNPLGVDEYSTYHYPEPKEYTIDQDVKEPEPVKAHDHGCDADRYVSMYLDKIQPTRTAHVDSSSRPEQNIKRIEWLKRGGSSRFSE